MVIDGIRGTLPTRATEGAPSVDGGAALLPTKTGEVSFEDLLAAEVNNASALDGVASAKASALSRGTLDDIHGTMIAAKEAEISLHLVGTIRNRLLDAFHELWRTSV